MKTFARASLATLLALVLSFAATAAYAIEYDDVIGLAREGVSDRTIVELIVKDGRAFDMNEDEIASLRDEGVSEVVIDAMLDPVAGQDWLDGRTSDDQSYDQGGYSSNDGYSTSLDQAYGRGYSDGRSTALVFSFGYYYGPLARYYYCDPFYYPFWSAGYASSYWPSYCAFYWRPAYAWAYSYPYNWYNYNSYYCYTYYDPGYYNYRGYTVQPGYGRTVWDNGPRWRNGGLPPGGNGRLDGSGAIDRVRERLFSGRPSAPPVVVGAGLAERPSGGATSRGELPAAGRWRDGRVARGVSPTPGAPSPIRRVIRSNDPVRREIGSNDPVRRVVRSNDPVRREVGLNDPVRRVIRSDVPARRGPSTIIPGERQRGGSRTGTVGGFGREGRFLRPQPAREVIRGSDRSRGTPGGYDMPRRIIRSPETRAPAPRQYEPRQGESRQVGGAIEQVIPQRERPAEARDNRPPPPETRPAPSENRQPQPDAIRGVQNRWERQDRGR